MEKRSSQLGASVNVVGDLLWRARKIWVSVLGVNVAGQGHGQDHLAVFFGEGWNRSRHDICKSRRVNKYLKDPTTEPR